ncbi:hypothetical protein NXF25_015391 [Crotalus adamanteus]|uniref:Uncharacterized protein n=1 Tax=Crotalus adamanteus TaxID=8729 RepID=A0AAW1AZA1_CROAD
MQEALLSQDQERNHLKMIGGGLAFLSLELQAVRRSGPIVMQAPPLGITMEVAPWPPSGLSASLPFAVGPSSCQVRPGQSGGEAEAQRVAGGKPRSSFLSVGQVWGSDMSSQETPQARRFPIEAGDSPSLATAPETQEPVAPERAATRQLRRCPGCHCLTLPNVPIDVYIAMGQNRLDQHLFSFFLWVARSASVGVEVRVRGDPVGFQKRKKGWFHSGALFSLLASAGIWRRGLQRRPQADKPPALRPAAARRPRAPSRSGPGEEAWRGRSLGASAGLTRCPASAAVAPLKSRLAPPPCRPVCSAHWPVRHIVGEGGTGRSGDMGERPAEPSPPAAPSPRAPRPGSPPGVPGGALPPPPPPSLPRPGGGAWPAGRPEAPARARPPSCRPALRSPAERWAFGAKGEGGPELQRREASEGAAFGAGRPDARWLRLAERPRKWSAGRCWGPGREGKTPEAPRTRPASPPWRAWPFSLPPRRPLRFQQSASSTSRAAWPSARWGKPGCEAPGRPEWDRGNGCCRTLLAHI